MRSFDPTALAAAFEANAALGDAATGSAPAEDLASKEVQVVAADIGLDRDAANALMGACLIAAHEGTETDPQKIRRIPECSIIAVGMAFGVLSAMRAARDAAGAGLLFVLDAEQARIVQEFIEGTRHAARNPQERELLKRLRVFAEDAQ